MARVGAAGRVHHATARRFVAALVACALICAPLTSALAEESDLEALQNAAIEAGTTYQEAQDRVEALEQEIESNQSQIDALEAELPAKRESASKAIRIQYKLSQDQPNLIGMLLSSADLNEFIEQLYYLDSIASANTDAINDLNEAQNQLNVTQAQLAANLEEADTQRAAAEQALEDAQQKAEAAKQKALEDAAANQAAYEAEQAAGEPDPTIAEAQAAGDATSDASDTDSSAANTDSTSGTTASSDGSATTDSNATSSDNSSPTSNQSDGGSASSSSTTSGGSQQTQPAATTPSTDTGSSAASYTYVQASMYGEGDGFMYGTTASGDIVTPTSMGVAMKTMPLGTVIEITYNGNTVRAVVNDRGPYVGNRQIDLQPAVAHALGFDGVGTVGYRVVG